MIPPIAIEKDQEAINSVMQLLKEEDDMEELKELVKATKIKGVRLRFMKQVERNLKKEDVVFMNAQGSRPQSAAAIRSGAKFGMPGGGRNRPQSAAMLLANTSSDKENENAVLRRHQEAFGFAFDDDEERVVISASSPGESVQSGSMSHVNVSRSDK